MNSKEDHVINPDKRKYGTFSLFTMDSSTRNGNFTCKVFADFIILSIVAAFIALFFEYLTPFQRGYFCNDENIMYPIKKEIVTNGMLYSAGVLIPLALIVITEVARNSVYRTSETSDVYFCGWQVPYMFQRMYISAGSFLFGVVLTEITSDFFKVIVGRPRPSFLELCKPDFNCSEVDNPHFYVQDYKCTNTELKDKNDMRLSFPSGHTAGATYMALYCVLYLHKRMTFSRSALVKPVIQYLLLLLAVYVSLTRIQDNHHHWDDVFAGFLLGLIICLTMVFVLSDLFDPELIPPSEHSARNLPNTEFS